MSTLRHPVKFLDWIMNKKDHSKMYLVLHEGVHNVWVCKEGEEPFELPKRMINMVYTRVNPESVKVLFGEKGNEVQIDTSCVESESTEPVQGE